MRATIAGVFLFGMGVLPAILAQAFLLVPSSLLMWHPSTRPLYRWWTGLVQSQWFTIMSLLLERYCGIKYVFTGDEAVTALMMSERKFVISNHRTRLDWMFLWPLGLRFGWLHSLKIVLKSSLRSAPVIGWAMQMFRFLFLHRRWASDKHHMTRLMKYTSRQQDPMTLLIFPEGTDLNPPAIEQSNKFAADNGVSPYKYVLHPRVTGTNHLLDNTEGLIDAIYDVTIGYCDYQEGERPSEGSILANRMPREIHVHVSRHPIQTINIHDARSVQQFIQLRFAEKEKRLTSFYEVAKKFDGVPLFNNSDDITMAVMKTLIYHAVLAYVCVWSILFGRGLLFLAASWLTCAVVTKYGGGWDMMELSRHDANWVQPVAGATTDSLKKSE